MGKMIDFFNSYDIELADYLLRSKPLDVIVIDSKVLKAKEDMNHLTFAQFIELSDLISVQMPCFDLIRSLILIFHWSELTNDDFVIANYKDKLPLINDVDIRAAYPLALKYRCIMKRRVKLHCKLLNSKVKEDYKQAGIDRFNQFGMYNSCRAVAKSFSGITPDDVALWNYHRVFVELFYQKVENEFQEKLTHILTEKNKTPQN